MKYYAHYGHTDFAIALDYKGEYIKRWFADFGALEGSLTVRTRSREIINHHDALPDSNVDLVETGLHTLTGRRIKRLRPWVGDSTFMLTWGTACPTLTWMRSLNFIEAMDAWRR